MGGEIQPIAGAISTYGLYAIIAILCLVVVHLYRRLNALEKEVRDEFQKNATKSETHASELAKLLAQTNNTLQDNTKAFMDFQNTLNELKSTIQLITGRLPHGD